MGVWRYTEAASASDGGKLFRRVSVRHIGVDLAKGSFTACFLEEDDSTHLATYSVTPEGLAEFRGQLSSEDRLAIEVGRRAVNAPRSWNRASAGSSAGVLKPLDSSATALRAATMEIEVPARNFGVLPDHLRQQLLAVEPSKDWLMEYRPCRVILNDGSAYDRVYVAEYRSYIKAWGRWPDQDPGKQSLRIEDVHSIVESPVRLPARFANQMYAAGESGMGYCTFVLGLRDGRQLSFVSGNTVDFLDLPSEVTPDMIVEILPHAGTRKLGDYRHGAPYYWCLYRNKPAKSDDSPR